MVALHAFLALAAGFATMAALIALVTLLLQKLTPGWANDLAKATAAYLFVNLGSSFLAAAAGGYVTAWVAQHNPLIHVLALAIVALLLAALSALQQRGRHPAWYMLTLVALAPLGAFAGGIVRLRILGIL